MKKTPSLSSLTLIACFGVALMSCEHQNSEDQNIVSQKYIHKYGHEISQDEWESRKLPGQVVTSLRNGVTVVTSYEGGLMHGQTTYTHPYSQTIESLYLYDSGRLVKLINYDRQGLPLKEDLYHSTTRHTQTHWYANGTPKSIEQYANEELVEGEYFNATNVLESKIENGTGTRVQRDLFGALLSNESFERGFLVKSISYHANGAPSCVTEYLKNVVHGQKKTFTPSGEPLSIEEWDQGVLNGNCVYFQNGMKFREISYKQGKKEGRERFYTDGEKLSEETEWRNDVKDGPSIIYLEHAEPVVEYFYNGRQTSHHLYKDMRGEDPQVTALLEEFRAQKKR